MTEHSISSCSKDDGVKPCTVTSISGILDNSLADYTEVGVSWDYGDTFVKTATVSNQSFTIELPTPPPSELEEINGDFDEIPSSVKINISDKTAKVANLYLYAIKRIDSESSTETIAVSINYGAFSISSSGLMSLTGASYMYVDKNVTLSASGKGNEDGMKFDANMNLNLKTGWNSVVTTMSGTFDIVAGTGNIKMSMLSGAVPSGLKWMGGSALPF